MGRREERLSEELREHFTLLVEEHLGQGMSEEEAVRRARLRLGGADQIKEAVLDGRRFGFFDGLRQDLRYALRTLARQRTLSTVVILSLALGIGANTAIFTVINAVMLQALPVGHPDELVLLNWTSPKWPGKVSQSGYSSTDGQGHDLYPSFSYHAFQSLRQDTAVFASVFAWAPIGFSDSNLTAISHGEPHVVAGEMVSGSYFSGLGVSPAAGRVIVDGDEGPDTPRVLVISYGYWTRQFARDPAVLGRDLTLNGQPYTVVGVAPPEFFGVDPGRRTDLWVPIAASIALGGWGSPSLSQADLADRENWWLMVAGRLRPGVGHERAGAVVQRRFEQELAGGPTTAALKPEDRPRIVMTPASKGLDRLRTRFSRPLTVLMAMVGLVLLIACANVATLLLARATSRRREIAVRLAVGASRARLIRQLLTESAVAAGLAGALGVVFAVWGSRALVLLMAGARAPTIAAHVDPTVLAFTAAISLVTGLASGLAPAFHATRRELRPSMPESTSGPHGRVLGKVLVATQIALSLTLLVGAALLVRTLVNLRSQDLRFNPRGLLVFTIAPPPGAYDGSRLTRLYEQIRTDLQRVPGVESATMTRDPLLAGWSSGGLLILPGPQRHSPDETRGRWNLVGPTFCATAGIRLLAGRDLELRDLESAHKVAVVNRSWARYFYGDASPLGQTFSLKRLPHDAIEIVGVADDAKTLDVRQAPAPLAYVPYTQFGPVPARMVVIARTSGDPMARAADARAVMRRIDPMLPLIGLETETAQMDQALSDERMFAQLSTAFAGLALLLAAIGLHGTMGYSVMRRVKEIGIRLALGARPTQVLAGVLREALAIASVGVAAGVAASLGATRLIASQLFGVTATDPAVLGGAVLALLVASAVVAYLPARRAARVDPLLAVRTE